VVDLSREPLIFTGYNSPAHALRNAAESYYKNLWLKEPHYVQVWIEKQGLIETIRGVCARRNVSLWPAKGYASRSFLRRAVKETFADSGIPRRSETQTVPRPIPIRSRSTEDRP
jgi:hypothetical protein